MKIQNALVSSILDRSQRYFTHVTTVTLSWRAQNIVVVGRVHFTLECFEFSSNFEFDRNMLCGTGAWCGLRVWRDWCGPHVARETWNMYYVIHSFTTAGISIWLPICEQKSKWNWNQSDVFTCTTRNRRFIRKLRNALDAFEDTAPYSLK